MNVRPLYAAALLALPLTACGGGGGGGEDGATTVPEAAAASPVAPPAGQDWTQMAVRTPEDGVRIGNPDAAVKLIEYASLTCGHCADFSAAASAALRDRYVASGTLSYEIRNQIHDPIDLTMARLVRCGDPATFQPLAEQVWANLEAIFAPVMQNEQGFQAAVQGAAPQQRFQVIAQQANLYDFFAQRGLSQDQAAQCLADVDGIQGIAERSQEQSDRLNIAGTPTFIVNGTNIGTTDWEKLEPQLQRAGARPAG